MRQTGLQSSGHLDDTTVWSHVMFYYCCFLFNVGVAGHKRLPLAVTLSLCETVKLFCGLENVTRTSIETELSSKCVDFYFNVGRTIPSSYIVEMSTKTQLYALICLKRVEKCVQEARQCVNTAPVSSLCVCVCLNVWDAHTSLKIDIHVERNVKIVAQMNECLR